MDIIKIHVLHCGQVKTTRWLPFNKDQVSMVKVAGLFVPEKDWEWLLVACYYIRTSKGKNTCGYCVEPPHESRRSRGQKLSDSGTRLLPV